MKKAPRPHSKKKPYREYIKYSGLGFQLLAVILLGVFIGSKLDQYFELESGALTAAFSLLFTIIGMYIIIREVNK
ncbi:MAG: hypothetical protein DRI33_04800 [Caldiserica bacterium]|nr:MAG: hypothetical protein DRI33_04800 [Caldisericota bacterium]